MSYYITEVNYFKVVDSKTDEVLTIVPLKRVAEQIRDALNKCPELRKEDKIEIPEIK